MSLLLPPAFATRMDVQLGAEAAAFHAALAQPAPVSLRLNPAKATQPPPGAQPVPWHPQGWYLPQRPVFTLDPQYHAGAYYVQEASSMLLYQALQGLTPTRVLDLCAAPGGKTTLLDAALSPEVLLVAHEVVRNRAMILQENLQRWGVRRPLAISTGEVAGLAGLAGFFDLVLVDAPCSGEGLFRKQPEAVAEWSEAAVAHCATRQADLLSKAMDLVAEGGTLIYSTCTYAPAENASQVHYLQSHGFALSPFPVDAAWGWTEITDEHGNWLGWQAYPHRVQGEGLFISRLIRTTPSSEVAQRPRKLNVQLVKLPSAAAPFVQPGNWAALQRDAEISLTPAAAAADLLHLAAYTSTTWLQLGLPIGEAKGQAKAKGADWVPHHALALSPWLADGVQRLPVTAEQALRFLKREPFQPISPGAPGWAVVAVNALPVGWGKVIPGRLNNYLPAGWRIRMELPDEVSLR